jgi:hypothetical protein
MLPVYQGVLECQAKSLMPDKTKYDPWILKSYPVKDCRVIPWIRYEDVMKNLPQLAEKT